MSAPVILQAGGKGTRLRPYSSILPKPLMPVGELPILEIVVRQLVNYGFTDLFISTGHLAHLIENYFSDGKKLNVHITYLHEDKPLGTVGPVRLMAKPEQPFIVMNGDLLTDLNYRALYDFHLKHDSPVTVAVYKERIPVSLGVINFDSNNQIIAFQEKPDLYFWASMGVYVFSPDMWDAIPDNTQYGFDRLMEDMLGHGKIARVFPWDGLWFDIGRKEDFEQASLEFERAPGRFLP